MDHISENQTILSFKEKFDQVLTEYVTCVAPRLFALCQDPDKHAGRWIFAWGAAFDDSAVVFSPNGKLTGAFSSADSALDMFSRTQKLWLFWVDPTICDQCNSIAD
jgi:hypothetical protein